MAGQLVSRNTISDASTATGANARRLSWAVMLTATLVSIILGAVYTFVFVADGTGIGEYCELVTGNGGLFPIDPSGVGKLSCNPRWVPFLLLFGYLSLLSFLPVTCATAAACLVGLFFWRLLPAKFRGVTTRR